MSTVIYHLTGDDACGKPALEWLPEALPVEGQRILSTDFKHLDGSTCEVGFPIGCDTCGRPLILSTKNFKKVSK